MDRSSPLSSPSAFAAPACVIGRRAFLQRCGVAGAGVLAAGWLAGCAGAPEIEQQAQPPAGFFADGTDFAD
jgi:hypothetical protein